MLDGVHLTSDTGSVAVHPDVDIVVELIGGIEPARELVMSAIGAGRMMSENSPR